MVHRSPYWRYLLAAVSGTLYFLGFVGFDQWYLAWFCFVPLLFALEGASPKQGLFLGWFAGTVALSGGFYWITHTLHVFAFMPWAVSGLGCVVLAAAQANEFALFGFIYVLLRKRTSLSPLLLAPMVFVAAEFVSPQLFPHYFANSQYMNIPLIQMCDITGVLGLTALLVFVNAAIYVVVRDSSAVRPEPVEGRTIHGSTSSPRTGSGSDKLTTNESRSSPRTGKWKEALIAALLVGAVLAYGYIRLPQVERQMRASPSLKFGIAQADLGIREKNMHPLRAIQLNQEQTVMLKEMGADIVVWPETAIQEPVLRPETKTLPGPVFDDLGVPILAGAFQIEYVHGKKRLYNIGVLADKDAQIQGIYKKQKLLMLGEYIPLGETFPELYGWFPYIGRMTPGNSNEPLKFGDHLLSVNICYEEILPRLINKMAAFSPNVFVNMTNDNWFGRTNEAMQHLVLASFRSVEHRRWLVRATNTGISAFVDATGRIIERSPLMEPAVLIHDVPMLSGRTLYARLGDWPGWGSIAGIILLILKKRKLLTPV